MNGSRIDSSFWARCFKLCNLSILIKLVSEFLNVFLFFIGRTLFVRPSVV